MRPEWSVYIRHWYDPEMPAEVGGSENLVIHSLFSSSIRLNCSSEASARRYGLRLAEALDIDPSEVQIGRETHFEFTPLAERSE